MDKNLPPQQLSLVDRCFHPNGTFVEFKKEEIEQSVPDRFEEQVRKYPQRLAVKTTTQDLTYEELNQAANRIAHSILAKIGNGQERVALLFEQSNAAIAAILGALKAGKICVPLDRSVPLDRLKYILGNSNTSLILTNEQNLSLSGELIHDKSQVLNIDDRDSGHPSEDPRLLISPGSPASIAYTSGSTGEPKGVIHSHQAVLHMAMNATSYFHICQEDRLALLPSYSLQAGTNLIFLALFNGASLHPVDLKDEGLDRLGEWISQRGITVYYSVPTVFRQMASLIEIGERLSTVRLVQLGGGQVDQRDVELFRRYFSRECILVGRLGSTEVGNYSLYFLDQESPIEGSVVPCGYTVSDQEVLLLGDDGREVGPGGIGEIAVRSPFLALGYWRLPELTQTVFRPDPDGRDNRTFLTGDLGQWRPDGSLLHLGRKDLQVKIRGYRVEVSEIELALLAHEAVADSVVIAQENWRGEKQLVAYIVGKRKKLPLGHDLRRFLRAKIPDYMIPANFVGLDSLPMLPGGKIDRSALPRPAQGRTHLSTPFVPPRSVIEQVLADIWAQVLEVDLVGRDDDFLDLGGDSLLASALLVHVEEAFQKKLPLAALIQASTVAQMAKTLGNERWSSAFSCLVPIQPNGDKPPFFCVHGVGGHVLGFTALSRHLGEDQPVYGLESAGRDGEQQPLTQIEAMAARYIKEIQTVQPQGPYHLGGFSMGGVIAFEMAQQLQAAGQDVPLLALFDSDCRASTGAWRRRRDLILRELRNSPKLLQRNPSTNRRLINEKLEIVAGKTFVTSPVDKPNRKATSGYRPGPYPGKVTLFWAADRPEGPSDPRWGWGELAELGVDIHRIPGDHLSILREPQLQVLAGRLKDCLDKAI